MENREKATIGSALMWLLKMGTLGAIFVVLIISPTTSQVADRIGITIPSVLAPNGKITQNVTKALTGVELYTPIDQEVDLDKLQEKRNKREGLQKSEPEPVIEEEIPVTEETDDSLRKNSRNNTELDNLKKFYDTNGSGSYNRDKTESKLRSLSDQELRNVDQTLAIFDLKPVYGFENATECGDIGISGDAVAFVCNYVPDTVFFKDKQMVNEYGFGDIIKHEIAHTQMLKACGVYSPDGAKGRQEAVTSSYAVLFLGANRENLNSITDPQYKTDAESDRIAKDIRNGKICLT